MVTSTSTEHAPGELLGERDMLHEAVAHAIHLLPTQGPISVFVHHNTLHALEDLPFDEALRAARKTWPCEVYLSENRYRQEMERGRIQTEDLFAALIEDLGDKADDLLGFQGTRCHLRLAMLKHRLGTGSPEALRWLIAEADALRTFRSDCPPLVREKMIQETKRWATHEVLPLLSYRRPLTRTDAIDPALAELLLPLFGRFDLEGSANWSDDDWETFCLHLLYQTCLGGTELVPPRDDRPHNESRPRDLLFAINGEDSDPLVEEVLIRFCAAYVDQGLARWTLPNRDDGFWPAFAQLYRKPRFFSAAWLRGLPKLIAEESRTTWSAEDSILRSLHALGIPQQDWPKFIERTLLALPGWGGMLWQLEEHIPWAPHTVAKGTLLDFLAVRLLLDRLATTWLAKATLGFRGSEETLIPWLRERQPRTESHRSELRAFNIFQLAQVQGWSPALLAKLGTRGWEQLLQEIEDFSADEQRRVFHMAYERRYRNQALDALSLHARAPAPPLPPPRAQVICCIDDREESFRRHLEEVAPNIETIGAAGFFSVPMYYRGIADAHFIPLCPVVVTPKHYVREQTPWSLEQVDQSRAGTRRTLGQFVHRLRVSSHTISMGIVTSLLGAAASVPLVARVLFPRTTARIRSGVGNIVRPPGSTFLELERIASEPGMADGARGFSVDEMTDMVERLLRDTGLTANFAQIVLFFGHGSSSLNNPHESAYNCGACGGGRGGPNARAIAHMANDPRVRERLAARGITLSHDVVFVGAFHNTCNDHIQYFDLDNIPVSHRQEFLWLRDQVDQARMRNAQERCRWFRSAELDISPSNALRHVEERSEDLAQARPEYNHATNALCIVGRRQRTRGLFLDRRSFLTSYDPTQDDAQGTILGRILGAVIPVCAGISLEYFFSCVDSEVFGCGSKLPHNVTSLVGVMTGAASDLKTGLSRQMIETHEPMRIVFVLESKPDIVMGILDRQPNLKRVCQNDWVQLAVLAPESDALQVWQNGKFVPYQPESSELPLAHGSLHWYRGWRDYLGFAQIQPEVSAVPEGEAKVR